MQGAGLLGLLVEECPYVPDQSKRAGIPWIQGYSPFRQFASADYCCRWILRPGLPDQQKVPVCRPRMSRRVRGFFGDRRFEHVASGMKAGGLQSVYRGYRTKGEIISARCPGLAGQAAFSFAKQEFRIYLCSRLGGDFSLQHQCIGNATIDTASPYDVPARSDVDQPDE